MLYEPMKRHPPFAPPPQDAKGAAIALGNFDGVHVGHQAVIASARMAAAALGCALGVAVFEPHPRRFFQPETPPFRLQTSAQRARGLANLGAAHLFEIGFDSALTQSSDREFAERILAKRLGVAHVSVGADFRFGRSRMGDAESLKRFGVEFGFEVNAVAPVESNGARCSSSLIRDALAAGDVLNAAAMLGGPWAVESIVQRGFGRGRAFGFPTANLSLGEYVRPRLGIYAVRVAVDGVRRSGVASVGINPTVGALAEPVLEAHLFDFDADLYGQTVEVEFMAFLRDELKFDGVDRLKRQMAEDARAARAILS